jgi:hypothetical protein
MVVYHGSQVKVAAKTANTVAFTDVDATTDVSFEFNRDLEEVYIHGDPAPQELKAGHYSLSGTLTRDFETGDFSATGMRFNVMAMGTTEMFFAIFPEGDAFPKILLSNVKFSGYTVKSSLKGIVQETCKFKGLILAVTES